MKTGHLTLAAALLLLISATACADVLTGRVGVLNDPPRINSVKTFNSYVNSTYNTPCSNFSAPQNRTVYIQVNVSDYNGAQEINGTGSVKVRIVLWDTVQESAFSRFGGSYLDASLEHSSGLDAIHTYAFEMKNSDYTRTGTETPPLYYRVKAEVLDGEYAVTSNLSSQQNADYTYYGLPRVLINELKPNFNGAVGFIELYNTEPHAVDLTDWILGDSNQTSSTYNLTGSIQPGGFNVYYSNITGIHLNDTGDEARLLYPGGHLIDNFTYYDGQVIGGFTYDSSQPVSIGRITDGGDNWTLLFDPTPGYSNEPPGGGGGRRRILPTTTTLPGPAVSTTVPPYAVSTTLPAGASTTLPSAATSTTVRPAGVSTTTLPAGASTTLPGKATTSTIKPPEPVLPPFDHALATVIAVLLAISVYLLLKRRKSGAEETLSDGPNSL